MQSAKRIGRLRAWFSGLTLFVLVCAFLGWGIRELLFPPTDACAIERTGKRSPLDSSQVYPIKNNIELIGHVGGEAESVFVRGNIAFVKLGLELAAFDIQNPSDPRRVGYILMGGDLIHVDADGNNAYLYSSGDLSGLWKIDTADPTQMSAAHIYDPIFYVASIRMLGEQAYITTQTCEYMTFIEGSIKTRCDDALHIVDTANPDAPVKCYQGWLDDAVRSFAVSNAPELITASKTVRQGNYKYVAEEKNGFKVYDVSNPLQPAEVGSYSPKFELSSVTVYKTHALTVSLENKNQELHYFLHVFDVATPTDPKDLGKLPYQPVLVTEFDHYAVLRQQFTHGNWPAGVEIVDMLFPDSGDISFAPVQIAEIVNMTVVGKRAYATTIDNNFLVLDISRIENPIPVVRYNLGGQGQLNYGISVVDNYAYIIVRDVGMRILNISDETAIKEVGTYKMESIPVELTAKEQYVYIAEWYGNLEIVDVSDPAQPTRIGVYDAGDRINKMHIIGNYLFMSTGPSGLQVLDISDPVSPFLVSSFVTGTYTTGVDINCQYIYVSDIENGLFVLKSNLLPAENCD